MPFKGMPVFCMQIIKKNNKQLLQNTEKHRWLVDLYNEIKSLVYYKNAQRSDDIKKGQVIGDNR